MAIETALKSPTALSECMLNHFSVMIQGHAWSSVLSAPTQMLMVFFRFLNNPGFHAQCMTKKYQRYRAKWTATCQSVLCSEYFNDESFKPMSELAAKFGKKKELRLKE